MYVLNVFNKHASVYNRWYTRPEWKV